MRLVTEPDRDSADEEEIGVAVDDGRQRREGLQTV
jgi:hypothetical protein